MQPVQKIFGHILLPSLKVNKRTVELMHLLLPSLLYATCTKFFVTFSQVNLMQPVQNFFGHLLLPSLKVNKRIVDVTYTKVLW